MSFISYEQFGVNFVAAAVSPERVRDSIAEVSGDSFQMGPMAAGPGGVAVAKADGTISAPEVQPVPDDDLLKFRATLTIDLNLEVRLAAVPQRYRGEVKVPLNLTVRTIDPLTLLIEIAPVVARDVHVELQSSGIGASVLQKVGNMDDEVRTQVARVVSERMDTEKARAAREIDVGALIEKTLEAG